VVEPVSKYLTDLESAICDATNCAFMLAATVEMSDDEDKSEALAYGVYRVQDLIKAAKEAYGVLHEKIRQHSGDGDETHHFTDDEGNKKKAVNLH
jgi:hypothetical protein